MDGRDAIAETLGAEPIDAEELYRAHARYVAAFLGRLGARPPDMEDLLQEVFLVAHKRGGFVPGAARPTTWLCEIALRVWSNARRKRGSRRDGPDDAALARAASPASSPEDVADARGALGRVAHCLDALGDEHRAVFVLFELDGVPTPEIAATLGVPVGTVHSRLHEARKQFRARWERSERGSPR